jgi:hypothetical protein
MLSRQGGVLLLRQDKFILEFRAMHEAAWLHP